MKKSSKEAFWREQLKLCAASSLSKKEFCKEQGYTYSSLQSWYNRLKPEAAPPTGKAFVPVGARPQQGGFSSLKVTLPNGVAIDYTGAIDQSLLKSLAAIGG